jgi:hypothetical protein
MGDEGDDQNVAIGNAIKTRKNKKKSSKLSKKQKKLFFFAFPIATF